MDGHFSCSLILSEEQTTLGKKSVVEQINVFARINSKGKFRMIKWSKQTDQNKLFLLISFKGKVDERKQVSIIPFTTRIMLKK